MNYWFFLLFIIKCNIISTTSLKFNCSQQIQIEQICDFELNISEKEIFCAICWDIFLLCLYSVNIVPLETRRKETLYKKLNAKIFFYFQFKFSSKNPKTICRFITWKKYILKAISRYQNWRMHYFSLHKEQYFVNAENIVYLKFNFLKKRMLLIFTKRYTYTLVQIKTRKECP